MGLWKCSQCGTVSVGPDYVARGYCHVCQKYYVLERYGPEGMTDDEFMLIAFKSIVNRINDQGFCKQCIWLKDIVKDFISGEAKQKAMKLPFDIQLEELNQVREKNRKVRANGRKNYLELKRLKHDVFLMWKRFDPWEPYMDDMQASKILNALYDAKRILDASKEMQGFKPDPKIICEGCGFKVKCKELENHEKSCIEGNFKFFTIKKE